MRRLGVAVLLLVTACTAASTPTASVTRSPSPSPRATVSPSPIPTPQAAPSLAAFYDGAGGKLVLVDSNGNVVTSVSAVKTHRNNEGLPWTSSSLRRLYFLDATGAINFFTPDGSGGVATHIKLAAGQEAGFSVSPDDQKIAVGVLSYSPTSAFAGTRLYVEDLAGAAHHVDIYSSPINAEFPIGWVGGRLIVALSTPLCCQTAPLNPYGALEYHVVDPASGHRFITLCGGTVGPSGPPVAAGVVCVSAGGQTQTYLGWDGNPCCSVGAAAVGMLSPDGKAQAWSSPNGIEVSHGPDSSNVAPIDVTGIVGDVEAWLDATHLIYRLRADSAQYIGLFPVAKVPQSGAATEFVGTFPPPVS